ncbi:MAG: 3-hydroxyacyl-CoA dehydrogenase NAD-binding domain-containing protein [Pseudomonadota bacterium]
MVVDDIKQVAVIGAGTMGMGIADLLSRIGGYRVIMADTTEELVQRGMGNIENSLQKYFVDKGKISAQDKEAILGRIKTTTDMAEAASQSDFVIEAVFENLELKKKVFKELDETAPEHAILVSNTSNQSVTEMANATNRPDKVGGMHFFNPVAVMKLVEVVRAPLTSEETAKTIYDLSLKLGKEPVYCRDTYGFLANRAVRSRDDAVELVWAHIAPPEDIDKAVRLGYNRPMGPLELGDLTGTWGIWVSSEDDAIKELGFEKGRVHPLVRMMVRAGYTGGLGKKGIYDFWNEVLSKW